MKYVILVGDGMADLPLDALDGKTPLDVARTPALDALAQRGLVGNYWPIPEGMPPGSEIGNLSLFGYDARATYQGRAPIEAASIGVTLGPGEVAFRCNLVTLADGIMRDFTSGHISSDEGAALIAALNETLARKFPIAFYPGVSYRHLAVLSAADPVQASQLVQTDCTPPHNIMDQPHAGFWPKGPAAAQITDIMQCSQEVVVNHPVSTARLAAGKLATSSIWLWGQGTTPTMASYKEKFSLTGAVISAVDLVRGLGILAGLDVIKVPGATGWLDTNYAGKVSAAIDALSTHDFVYVHVEAPDEASHQGRIDYKLQSIEDFDAKVVAPLLDYLDGHPQTRILVAPDHYTLISTKGHYGDATPFVLAGAGVKSNGFSSYSERIAMASGVDLRDGHRLTEHMLQDDIIEF